LERLITYKDPLATRYDGGYQLTQSLFGFAEGGTWGTGLGDGLQKLFFLPEAHNDFIAAIIGEELGMVGVWCLILVLVVVVARGVAVAFSARDEFAIYVSFGITVLIAVQALANLAVAMGLVPTKGLNLPFVSYGGTSLLISLFAVGVLLNISKSRVAVEAPETEERKSSGGNMRRSQIAGQGEPA